MQASDHVKLQGKTIDRLTYERYKSLNQLVRSKDWGGETSDITVIQAIGGAAASAGTHTKGGALDLTWYNVKKRCMGDRLLGGAGWPRERIPGVWERHYHTVTAGVGYAAATAQRQVTSLYNGRNGLANNGKDTEWRPIVWPLFVAPWTTRGKRGVYYAKKGYTMRNQPTTKGSSKGSIPSGAKFTVIAIVNAGGTLWAMNVDGKFLPVSVLSLSKPTTKPTPPLPTQKKALTMHVGTINVIRWRLGEKPERPVSPFAIGLNYYPDRCKGLAEIREKMGVSLFTTTESGQYKDADRLDEAMGKNVWSNVLHGDDAGDITSAIHWYNPKRKMLEEGKFSTGDAKEVAYHNMATWTLLRDLTGSDVIALVGGYHAEYRSRGTDKASKYDLLREKRCLVLFAELKRLAAAAADKYNREHIPILVAGDFNQDRYDFYDGPGRAALASGFVDADSLATSRSGPTTTFNGLDPKKVTGRRLDRLFVTKGVQVAEMITVPGYPHTDHNGVGWKITMSNTL